MTYKEFLKMKDPAHEAELAAPRQARDDALALLDAERADLNARFKAVWDTWYAAAWDAYDLE